MHERGREAELGIAFDMALDESSGPSLSRGVRSGAREFPRSKFERLRVDRSIDVPGPAKRRVPGVTVGPALSCLPRCDTITLRRRVPDVGRRGETQ
jgi:hypothetical protein